jgi:hypothetical protein
MKQKIMIDCVCLFCILILLSTIVSSVTVSYQIKKLNDYAHPSLLDLMNMVDNSQMEQWIQEIQDFGPHPTGSDELNNLKDYLVDEFSLMNVSVKLHPWEFNGKYGENIIATQNGSISNDIVIVCAHYDSIGISPGADDDGSGVASVLMLADILSQWSFSGSIQYILFSGEEQGLLGSREYVKEVLANNDSIIGVLALDKIGYAETVWDGSVVRHHADHRSEWMIRMSQSIAEDYFENIRLRVDAYSFDGSSDHKAFVDQGFVGSNFVENYLNPQYHTSEDLLENMNMTYLTKVCKLSLGVVARLAEFDPKLDNSDIAVKIVGTRYSDKCQFSVVIENRKFLEDTANVTINISMRHIFRFEYVSMIKDFYTSPATWEFDKEVSEQWEFKVSGRRFSRGLFRINVYICGFNDDVNLALSTYSYGAILGPNSMFMLSNI